MSRTCWLSAGSKSYTRRSDAGVSSSDLDTQPEQSAANRGSEKPAPGRVIKYVDNLWKGLVVFLEDPAVPIHNNDAERGMRSIAIGRKNHFGSRSKRGTEVAALFYSLLESAKMAGVDPA